MSVNQSATFLTPKPYKKPVANYAFGLQQSAVSWFPRTPRDPYVDRFKPTTPHSNWMTGLRIESSNERIGDYVNVLTQQEEHKRLNKLHQGSRKQIHRISTQRQRYFKLLKGGDVPKIAEMNDLKDVNVMRPCCWYGDKKEALDTGLGGPGGSPRKQQGSPEQKRNAQVVTIMTPGNGGGGDKGIRSRGSSEESDEVQIHKKLGFELYRRPKELPYMTFDQDSTDQPPNKSNQDEEEIWSEMAFVVCSKSKNDIKNLVQKVKDYEESAQQNANNPKKGRLRSGISNQKQSVDDSKFKQAVVPVVPTLQATKSQGMNTLKPDSSTIGASRSRQNSKLTSEDSIKKKTQPPSPKNIDSSTIRVENVENEHVVIDNLEQLIPETQTTEKANEYSHLVEEGKKYQKNGAQQLYEDILRQQKINTELTLNRPQLSSHGSLVLPSPRQNNEEQPPRASVFMSPNVSTFTFTNPQMNQENSPTSEKVKDPREEDSPNMMMSGAMTTMSSHPAQSSAQRFRRTSALRISAAGIETRFSSFELNQTNMNQFQSWKRNRMSRRTIQIEDGAKFQDQLNDQDAVSEQYPDRYQGLDGAQSSPTLKATAYSNSGPNYDRYLLGYTAGNQTARKTKNYYNGQEQLYGYSRLQVAQSSLMARKNIEYKRLEEQRNRDHILDEKKRKIILKA